MGEEMDGTQPVAVLIRSLLASCCSKLTKRTLAAHSWQRVNCCVARAQAGVLLSRLKFALPGWAQAEGRRAAEQRARFAQRAEQARAYSGEGRHSEEWGWSFGRPAH